MINTESKPGYLTTEFWLVLLANILPEIGAIDVGDARLKGLLHIVTVLGYAISRGLAKHGQPAVEILEPLPGEILPDEGDKGSL